jgi:uncharacterized protein YjiS (DUF1127 family)
MSTRAAISTAPYRPAIARPARGKAMTPIRLIRALLARLRYWHRRSIQRAELAALDDRMLKDIGLTRADVQREINKPFWQG